MMWKRLTLMGLAAFLLAVPMASAELPEDTINVVVVTGVAALNSTVVAGHRIYGFTAADSSAGACTLHDSATLAGVGASTAIGESRVGAGTVEPFMYPFPVKLVNGLVVGNLNSTGTCTVFYR